jgi:protein O-mannosyl-transferase
MASKPKKETRQGQAEAKPEQQAGGKEKLSLLSFRVQAIILAITGFLFYCNTFSHEYAFDDVMAIVDNEYVQQGVSGIPAILTSDAYQSYLERKNGSNQLAGGRYRPLSLITFAVEQQFLGVAGDLTGKDKDAKQASDMHERHVMNVLLYMLSAVLLLYFLRKVVFPGNAIIPFGAALLFIIHPVHTEVVANVKSRDEILSVLFILLTFIKAFGYRESKKRSDLILAMVFFFLALLSKEYAVMLVVLLPLSFYIFSGDSMKKSFSGLLPYLIPLGLYAMMRLSSVTAPDEAAQNNVMNNPYLFADAGQKIASKLVVLLDYIRLLFLPNVLVCDYSYNQIPYSTFSNPLAWVSLVLYIALIALCVSLVRKRHPLGFALSIYLLFLLLVSNFIVDIGAPMGERLIYHSSIGFAIVVAWLLYEALKKAGTAASRTGMAVVLVLLTVVCGMKTIARNRDWKNEETLFLNDIKISPNSVLVNNNAAASYMFMAKAAQDVATRNMWFDTAIKYFDHTIAIYPNYYLAHLNRGLCYYNEGKPSLALPDWDSVRKYSPNQANLQRYLSIAGQYFLAMGMQYGKTGKTDSAIFSFRKSVEATPQSPDGWYNLAVSLYSAGNVLEAKQAISKAVELAPNYAAAQQLYAVLKDK